MTVGRFAALRLSLFYAGVFAVIGVHLPLWAVWLEYRGLSPEQIGLVFGAAYVVKVAGNPLVGALVDRRGDRRRPIILLCAASLAGFFLFFPATGFWSILGATLLTSAAFSAMMPIADNLAMLTAGRAGLDYGRMRLWGSLSFIALAYAGGKLLLGAAPDLILWTVIAATAATLIAAWLLPELRVAPGGGGAAPPTPLLTDRRFLLFVACASLNQLSHMIYYGFATLHWQAAGLSGGAIGWLWAEGVIAEVVLFAFSDRVVARCGPIWLLAIAALGGAVRWLVLGLTTDPLALSAVQWLHAASFGAAHLAAMHFIARSVPAAASARAQSLYSSIAIGLAPGLGMLVAGRLYAELGGAAFLTTVPLSLAAAGLALVLLRLSR